MDASGVLVGTRVRVLGLNDAHGGVATGVSGPIATRVEDFEVEHADRHLELVGGAVDLTVFPARRAGL